MFSTVLFISAKVKNDNLFGHIRGYRDTIPKAFNNCEELIFCVAAYVGHCDTKQENEEKTARSAWLRNFNPYEFHIPGQVIYCVEIESRQNAWVGRVTCKLGKIYFRSTDELLTIMRDSCANSQQTARQRFLQNDATG